MKSYTDIEQSKKLAEFLPIESADMTLPFRHPKKDEYIPGRVTSRNYVEVYYEMMALPAMEKEDVCKLIQPSWSLSALLGVLPLVDFTTPQLIGTPKTLYRCMYNDDLKSHAYDNPIDACVEMILKLKELKML